MLAGPVCHLDFTSTGVPIKADRIRHAPQGSIWQSTRGPSRPVTNAGLAGVQEERERGGKVAERAQAMKAWRQAATERQVSSCFVASPLMMGPRPPSVGLLLPSQATTLWQLWAMYSYGLRKPAVRR